MGQTNTTRMEGLGMVEVWGNPKRCFISDDITFFFFHSTPLVGVFEGKFWLSVYEMNKPTSPLKPKTKQKALPARQLKLALFDISISNINCRYIDTFEKYRYRYGEVENIDIDIDIDRAILKNIDIDIDIDKVIPKISISISISIWWFWKISISISISIRQFCKISISIKYRIDSNLAYRTGLGATHILFSLAERKWGGILGKQSPGRLLEEVLCMWEGITRGVMPLIHLYVIGKSNSFREVQPYVNPHLYHLLQVT